MAQIILVAVLLLLCCLPNTFAHVGSNTASWSRFKRTTEAQTEKKNTVSFLDIYDEQRLMTPWTSDGALETEFLGVRAFQGRSVMRMIFGSRIIIFIGNGERLDSSCLVNLEFRIRATTAGAPLNMAFSNLTGPFLTVENRLGSLRPLSADYFVGSPGITTDSWSQVSINVADVIGNNTFNAIFFEDGDSQVEYFFDDMHFTTEERVPAPPTTAGPTTESPTIAPTATVAPIAILAQFRDCNLVEPTEYPFEVPLDTDINQDRVNEIQREFQVHFGIPNGCIDILTQKQTVFTLFRVQVNTREPDTFGDTFCDILFNNDTLRVAVEAKVRDDFNVHKCNGVLRNPGPDFVIILIIAVVIGVLAIALFILIAAFVQVIKWRNKSEALVVTKNPAYEIYKMYQDDGSNPNKRATMSQFAEFDVPDEDSYHEITYRDNTSPLAPKMPNTQKFDTMSRNRGNIDMNRQLPAAPVADRPLPSFDEY